MLFAEISDTLTLPISDYHKLKKTLNSVLEHLGVDRCSLLYPCRTDVSTHIVPIEATTPKYPGTSKLKAHIPTNPLFQHVCKTVEGTNEPIEFQFDSIESKELLGLYEKFSIKAQMVKLIELPDGEKWGLSIQQCNSARIWTNETKDVINKVANTILPILTSLLDIPTLLNIAESATEAIDNSSLAQVIYSMDRQIAYANEPYCQLNKRDLNSLLRQHGQQFLPLEEQYKFNQFFDDILEHGKSDHSCMKTTGDGNIINIEAHGSLITYNGSRHYLITVNDVSEKIIAQQQIQSYSDIQHAIMEASDDGMLVEDTNRKIIAINQTFFNTFDIPPNLLKEKNNETLEMLKAGTLAIYDGEKITQDVIALSPTSDIKTSKIMRLKNGKILDLVSFPLVHDNTIKGRVWYFKDITENTLLTQKLSFEATHDALTQLVNRRGFDKELSLCIDTLKQIDTVHALLYLDLDQFKIINDSCGHAAGDMALIEVSQLLLKKIRSADILARVGGDEFCILLRDCPPDVAHKLSDEIRQEIDDFIFTSNDKEYNLGVSIGIVSIDKNFSSYEDALKLADTSCYIAKEAGRNQIHIHTNADQAVALRLKQNNVVSQIHDALKTNRFTCYVQKICSVSDNERNTKNSQDSYEILVRMLDEKERVIPPNIFLPAAERYKLIYKIDHWVIKNAIHAMATIQDQFKWVSINLSGQTVAHKDSFNVIKESIKKSNINPSKICFEITETAAITNPEFGVEFLNKLQELGCLIALDDFGTGLSSYEYLKRLPADILKIDGQFIQNMLDEPLDLAMVKSINEISHIMGKKTVGEFVENAATLKKMKEIGIDYAQGFYLDTPKPLQTLLDVQLKKVANR
jgi:diguanylate cyclase (GGDEF)-like protein